VYVCRVVCLFVSVYILQVTVQEQSTSSHTGRHPSREEWIKFSKLWGQRPRYIEQGLTSHQTHYRSYRRRVFTGQMTQPTVSKQGNAGKFWLASIYGRFCLFVGRVTLLLPQLALFIPRVDLGGFKGFNPPPSNWRLTTGMQSNCFCGTPDSDSDTKTLGLRLRLRAQNQTPDSESKTYCVT